ncbi:MAG: response regulator [Cyanobacteria bacterium P01_D01_bin.156]
MKSTIDALLVEDSYSDAQLVQALLNSSEFDKPQIHHAERFEEALDMLQVSVFDVVLLDLHLPDGQGLSLIKRLKQQAPRIPVVVLTGTQDPIIAEAALQEGAQDYVVKSDTLSPARLAQQGYVDVGNCLVQRIRYAIKCSESSQNVKTANQARDTLITQEANDGTWDWNLRQNRIDYSPHWRSLLGVKSLSDSPEEWLSRIHPADRAGFDRILRNYLTRQQSKFHCEYRLRHQDGSYLWVLTRGAAVWDSSGTAERLVGCQTDMTVGPKSRNLNLQKQNSAQTKLHYLSIGLIANLADLYLYEGRDSEAEPLLQGVLAMRTWLLGPHHLDVAVSQWNLATLYDNQGRYTKAQPLFHQALEIFEQSLGLEHPSTKRLRCQLWLMSKMNQAMDTLRT